MFLRITRHLFYSLLMISLIVLPIRQSYAQLVETAGSMVLWGGGSAGVGSADLALMTALVGTNLGWIALAGAPFALSGDTTGSKPVDSRWKGRWYMDPSEMKVPEGWSRDPATGRPVPPKTTQPSNPSGEKQTSGNGFNICKTSFPSQNVVYATYANPGWRCFVDRNDGRGPLFFGHVDGPAPEPACAAGYAFKDGSCQLTNADQVTKPSSADDECVIVRNGNSFSADNSEACQGVDLPVKFVDAAGNEIEVKQGGFMVVPAGQDKASAWGEFVGSNQFVTTQNLDATQDYPAGATVVTTITNTGAKSVVTNQTITQGQTDKPATDAGNGSSSLTCEQLGTCGVAQETTLKSILDAITSIGDVAEVPDTTIEIPEADTSFMPNLVTPDLDAGILDSLFPKPVCTDPEVKVDALFLRDVDVPIPYCDWAEMLRPLFGYLWYAITVIGIFRILHNVRPSYEA